MYYVQIFSAIISIVSANRIVNNYLQASHSNNALSSNDYPRTTSPSVAIIRFNNDNNGDGTYKFEFETENRIVHQEKGQVKNAGSNQEINVIEGTYSYTGPDGIVYTINYIADENGFRASGEHIPTVAPIPHEIAESIKQNVADEAAGIMDDGQYRPENEKASLINGPGKISIPKRIPHINIKNSLKNP